METTLDPTKSSIEVQKVRGKSRVTRSVNISPLKILHPQSPNDCSYVVLSTYGGGMVQGDNVHLDVACHQDSKLYLGTQANTRIYKSINQDQSKQIIDGKLEKKSLAVFYNDPIVPHENSDFVQDQTWNLQENASLLLVDWMCSGRDENGEAFKYKSYTSQIKISQNDNLVLNDQFTSRPQEHNPTSPIRFGEYYTSLNIYFIGKAFKSLYDVFQNEFSNQELKKITDIYESSHKKQLNHDILTSTHKLACENSFTFRALAKKRYQLQKLVHFIFSHLKEDNLLGFNPLERKF